MSSGPVKVAIMQPYFLPYVGYWQLMHHVDIFVVYDDIEFTKKGWINRNRFLFNGRPELFSVPLKHDSDFLEIRQRQLSESFERDKSRLLRRLEAAYKSAPFLDNGMNLLQECLDFEKRNLFEFLLNSIRKTHEKLRVNSKLVVSSSLNLPRQLKGQERVIATCIAVGASDYVNPIGGVGLYQAEAFSRNGIKLYFQKVELIRYPQFKHVFVPNLSIIDNIMFNGLEGTRAHLALTNVVEALPSCLKQPL